MAIRSDIKKGDTVYILAGKSREDRLSDEIVARTPPDRRKAEAERHPGKRGKVLRVLREANRVVVDGVNIVTKHARPSGRTTRAAQQQTGRIQQPAALHLSNVMLVCPRCDRPTRVRRGEVQGKRVRICRRCGESMDQA
jgi:large subunit ribosomal protein L24